MMGFVIFAQEYEDAERDWNNLFSNEALGRVYSLNEKNRRATGVPCIYNAMNNFDLRDKVRELRMSPGKLIGYLHSIGSLGRQEFIERLSIEYNTILLNSGG